MTGDASKNAAAFRGALADQFAANLKVIEGHSASKLDSAYVRLTTLQAWRTYVLEDRLSPGALGFFTEAQSDGLASLAQAASGLWRPSLKSLRSLIENVVHCVYYADHPVEYMRWEAGTFRPAFASLLDYLSEHPHISTLPEGMRPVAALRARYGELSNAVHSSSKIMRMSVDGLKATVWKTDGASLGKWSTAQKTVLRDVNWLLLILLSEHLKGAAAKPLRETLPLAIGPSKDADIKKHLAVRLIR